MPRPKAVRSYPKTYLEFAQQLSVRPDQRITVEFENEREAKSFRLDFNSFKGAALREGLDAMFPEIAAFYVTVEGKNATVQHKDYTEQAERMRNALMKAQMEGLVKGV